MTDADRPNDREDIDDEHRFVRWVKDPGDRRFRVEAVTTFGVSGPVSLGVPTGGPVAQGLVKGINRVLRRLQPPARSHDTVDVTVCQVADGHEYVVFEQTDLKAAKGRDRARALVAQIENGRFESGRS